FHLVLDLELQLLEGCFLELLLLGREAVRRQRGEPFFAFAVLQGEAPEILIVLARVHGVPPRCHGLTGRALNLTREGRGVWASSVIERGHYRLRPQRCPCGIEAVSKRARHENRILSGVGVVPLARPGDGESFALVERARDRVRGTDLERREPAAAV